MVADSPRERGVVLVMVLLAMVLLTALGLSLTLVTSTESRIAFVYGAGLEAFYAADALLERVAAEVGDEPDWNLVLDGTVASTFRDGAPGPRTLPDGTMLDLVQETARMRCDRSACSEADLTASRAGRPWGANNPRWQIYASGPLANMSPGRLDSRVYVVAWVGDDPSENDGLPLRDGDFSGGANPGRDRLSILVQAYGAVGVRRVVTATVARGRTGIRVLSWREGR